MPPRNAKNASVFLRLSLGCVLGCLVYGLLLPDAQACAPRPRTQAGAEPEPVDNGPCCGPQCRDPAEEGDPDANANGNGNRRNNPPPPPQDPPPAGQGNPGQNGGGGNNGGGAGGGAAARPDPPPPPPDPPVNVNAGAGMSCRPGAADCQPDCQGTVSCPPGLPAFTLSQLSALAGSGKILDIADQNKQNAKELDSNGLNLKNGDRARIELEQALGFDPNSPGESGRGGLGGKGPDGLDSLLGGTDPSGEVRFGPRGTDHDILLGSRSRAGSSSSDSFLTNSAALIKELVFQSLSGGPSPTPSASPSSGMNGSAAGFVDPEDSSRLSPEEAERRRQEALLASLEDYLKKGGVTDSLFVRAHKRYQKVHQRWIRSPSPETPL